MGKIGRQVFQDVSEVEVFNTIGEEADSKGYDVVYFKALMPLMVEDGKGYKIEHKYMHYIHLVKDEEMKFSIYYDEYNLRVMYPEQPYFELYDRCDIERFLESEVNELFKRVIELI